jgi:anthranilate synthase component 2
MHGRTDQIYHCQQGIFEGLPNPLTATRYHSLVIEPGTLSDDFRVTAWCDAPDGSREIMAIAHREYPLIGWQFHPESFLTQCGPELLHRFIQL